MVTTLDIKEVSEKLILSLPGVVGIGLGHSSPETIHVYINKQCPNITCNIPQEIGGIPVKTIVTGRITSLQMIAPLEVVSRTARLRPYPGGVSVGSRKVTAGTLGVKCYDATTGEPLILTNNHVGANETSIQAKTADVGDVLLQPGIYDGGKYPEDIIGTLVRDIDLNRTGENEVDGVVHRPTNPDDLEDTILEIGKVTEIGEAVVGDEIMFSGRSSGLKPGTVVDKNATLKIDYENFKGAVFKNQIVTTAIGLGGDSSAIIVRKRDKKAVGFLFAGSDSISVANRMTVVAQALNINLGSPAPLPSQEPQGSNWGSAVALGMPLALFGIIKTNKKERRRLN